jgi:hypothetical protein
MTAWSSRSTRSLVPASSTGGVPASPAAHTGRPRRR